jgi:hypothetical protein
MTVMTDLPDAVLPLIRTRADLSRWSAANEHGRQMHEAVDILEEATAVAAADPKTVYAVTHKALAASIRVIVRADDSSGIIGNACRRLIELHPKAAVAAQVPPGKLIDWMIKFQFDDDVDYFTLDPVAYAPALGEKGVTAYRARLDEVRTRLEPVPPGTASWSVPNGHERFVLGWNGKRLAVLDHDIDAIIRTHARDRGVAAWFQDTAEAFEEIGEIDLAIDWARQGLDIGEGPRPLRCGDYWCTLLAEHRPGELLDARLLVFRRRPSSSTAARLYDAAGKAWPNYRDEVLAALAGSPRDAVLFAQLTLHDVPFAWNLAHSLGLKDDRTWSDLVKAYERIDPIAVLPVLAELVENELEVTDARNYRHAARRLAKMRKLAAGSNKAAEVDDFVAQLRETHRRRPRLQQEFDRAGLP